MGNESSFELREFEDVDAEDDAHALARWEAEADAADADDGVDDSARACYGFRVLGIQEQSPASRVGFVSFFDFIMAANGIRLDSKDATLMELIAQSEEQPMQLDVYNLKTQRVRQLELTPSRRWPGKGLLGVTIRFDSHEDAEDQLLHVLHVSRNSPAFLAGLRAGSDYLLGTPERVFRDPEDLYEEIMDALGESFQCYVYNADEDQVRIVSIAPSEHWGGAGVLGAEVGHGVLHRLPTSCRASVGTSIGFVSLSQEAKAATDPFLRQEPPPSAPGTASTSGTDAETENSQSLTTGVQQLGITATSADMGEIVPAEAAPKTTGSSQPALAVEVTPATSTELAEQSADSIPQANSAQAAVPANAVPAPATKPRYAARIDPMFPMSTVEVLADPTHLR